MKNCCLKNLSFLLNSLSISYFTLLLFIVPSAQSAPVKSLSLSIPTHQPFDLMLVGGGMKTCSSQAPANCQSEVKFSADAKRETRYVFNVSWLERALKHPRLQSLNEQQKANLRQAAKALPPVSNSLKNSDVEIGRLHSDSLTLASLEQAIVKIDKQFLAHLSDQQYYTLLDLLEEKQMLADGTLLQEQVLLDSTTNSHAATLYQLFTQQALAKRQQSNPNAKRPLIAVVTASARDPFEAAHYYVSVFEQIGAEVIWLPLDAALQAGIATRQCEQLEMFRQQVQGNTDRARLYPKQVELQKDFCASPIKLYQLLNQIDGLFLNGGDQSLTLKAWTTSDESPSEALSIIKKRLSKQEIVIGGTSAGTAVMADKNMITGGTSDGALSFGVFATEAPSERCEVANCDASVPATAVTYREQGGLGFFPFGIPDTHFSQRDRYLRLLLLSANVDSKMAFGVDENTALLVDLSHRSLSVVGEHGVWALAQVDRLKQSQANSEINAVSHYLTPGSYAEIDATGEHLTHIRLAQTAKLTSIMSKQSDFFTWVSNACRQGIYSTSLSDKYELTITPMAALSCQGILNQEWGYQSMDLTLKALDK
ncbi:cyanophycinase [Shewanella scandinavica]|uniref:cyanophycinase n=1 Tax=Shewanella scandinavica TaxID=3063538 RepID=UPI003191265F